ncbi:MAG TPA: hypothetical protein VK620_20090 [Bradyrhizobium sp.]|nr:hypothetical protein [Bradyrhizobium sp.]
MTLLLPNAALSSNGWAEWSPRERGHWVRCHKPWLRGDRDAIRELFNLTERGVTAILNGDDWHPDYDDDRLYCNPG